MYIDLDLQAPPHPYGRRPNRRTPYIVHAPHHIPQTTMIPQDHLHITYLGPMQAAGAGIALWNVVAKVALQHMYCKFHSDRAPSSRESFEAQRPC